MPKWQRQYESDRKYLPVWEQQTFQLCIILFILTVNVMNDELIQHFQIGVVSR